MTHSKTRCAWVNDEKIYQDYHDNEWGVPIYDNQRLFEFLILEGAQAGLSWITVLKKRENYRIAFDNFSAEKMALYDARKISELLNNPGIIRNRLKLNAAIINAQCYLQIPNFSEYLWSFVKGVPIKNCGKPQTSSPESDAMAKSLKQRGFKFVGTTICYAFMQAVGMVDDHSKNCFLHKILI